MLSWTLKSMALALALFGFPCLALAASPFLPSQARTLDLYNVNTRESLKVVYRQGDVYDEAALDRLDWFMRDWRRSEATDMDPRVFDALWEIYKESDADAPIHVHSGYRSPQTNSLLRRSSTAVAKSSQHMQGTAIDFRIPGVSSRKLRDIAMQHHYGGVGYYPTANNPFVHVDVASVRYWPRMSRASLAEIFPEGGTVFIPSDGRPLPGYQKALAEVERKRSLVSVIRWPIGNASQKADGLAAIHRTPISMEHLHATLSKVPLPTPRPTMRLAAAEAIDPGVRKQIDALAYATASDERKPFQAVMTAIPSALPIENALGRRSDVTEWARLEPLEIEVATTPLKDVVAKKGGRIEKTYAWEIGGIF